MVRLGGGPPSGRSVAVGRRLSLGGGKSRAVSRKPHLRELPAVLQRVKRRRADVLSMPSIVSLVGEEATIQVAEHEGDHSRELSHSIKIAVDSAGDTMELDVHYAGRDGRRSYKAHTGKTVLPGGKTLVVAAP